MNMDILAENARRHQQMQAPFDPITGMGSIGPRKEVTITGLDEPHLWLPETMLSDPWVHDLIEAGSVSSFRLSHSQWSTEDVVDQFVRIRCEHDFAYWAAKFVYIKCKGGGDDVLFRLSYAQRKFVERLESLRRDQQPIRIVLLKARQWGGSTTSQLYMAWLQLVHSTGLNSLIIAHQGTASDEIKDMFDRMMHRYPLKQLHAPGEEYKETEKKITIVGRSGSTVRVPQRNCKIKIGTAERPNSCRGGDYNLVHLSEVGLWKVTDGKRPEDIVRAACSGVVYKPYTMIVYESTANGVGNFFHREYIDARDNARSQFRALFISWYDIEHNQLEFRPEGTEPPKAGMYKPTAKEFAEWLVEHRHQTEAPSTREEPGQYLWWLWEKGATLEGINWYITERAKHSSHGSMAAECPSDDTEAFVNSGAAVFDKYLVEKLRAGCRAPKAIGEIETVSIESIDDAHFTADPCGNLWVWEFPGKDKVADRYLTIVDVGGRSDRADWSVVMVLDRYPMIYGDSPAVVAQWRGHCDMDILAWKAAGIAAYYDNALLVIESNTLETHDAMRMVDGDQSHFILNQIRRIYPYLYARRQSVEDISMGKPRKYGFHTNVSTKPMIISTLVKMVRERMYVERDERCLNEMLTYERRPNGSYGAIVGEHDDLLMTRAIGLHICFYEMARPRAATVGYASRPRTAISEATFI